jgi:hypothetical protein
MRYLTLLFTAFVLTACSLALVTRINSDKPASSTPDPASELQEAAMDSVVQFLLTSAATDFKTHRPPDPVSFRDVRIGHIMTQNGEEQYMLCGQFLTKEWGRAVWTPFATIKTSGYEQWLGAQAAGFCQGASVVWDKDGDLSSLLQSRYDSLRLGAGGSVGR